MQQQTMSSTMQQGSFLDVLKKKIRQTKEECEKFEEEAEEYKKKYLLEVRKREEVSRQSLSYFLYFVWKWAGKDRLLSFTVEYIAKSAFNSNPWRMGVGTANSIRRGNEQDGCLLQLKSL